ncbi:hypothetical protein D0C36_14350 [Mucilaginibacter conchicola]|uniref:Lipocalin-like domain-containing protein n=1 Tax=Mucilaginibacter conchicola TaxID=2303333 RepID=A0A372NUA5_9SPHI|nr:lipocalin family protein [Mucilaginibacter conchicola]RFZ92594.1 hypothetical protein D0C36_14350 [Mucilaginibacter conchicola]
MTTFYKLSLKTYIVLLLSVLAFAGCSKKKTDGDSPSSVDKAKIVGKWYYVTTVEKDKEDGSVDTDTWTNGEYVMFNSDGTLFDSDDNETGTYSISGNKITLSGSGQTNVAEVKKLTSSQLILYYNGAEYESTVTFRR